MFLTRRYSWTKALALFLLTVGQASAWGDGGSLTVEVSDETTDAATITRFLVWRGAAGGKSIFLKRTVPAGIGAVLDRKLELSLADGAYSFRMIRGPEYRIISGTFSLERSSLDTHSIRLPRMVDMLANGWTSGDCLVTASANSLPLRMASEDLHLVRTMGHVDAKPIPGRGRDEPPGNDPSWISSDASHFGGLVFYGPLGAGPEAKALSDSALPADRLVLATADQAIRVAIENPFAWPLPIWLASGQIDGLFLLGDWLRLDRKVLTLKDGRGPAGPGFGDGKSLGRWAERIYWNMLESGFRIPPLAGSGSDGRTTPVGYNRLYVAQPIDSYSPSDQQRVRRVASQKEWWDAAWAGRSVATNGPLLRPTLGGEIPGHVFTASAGEKLQLQAELNLSVRDPVDYLEVIRNGKVHYSARLDEFAQAGGVIPPMLVTESSWVTIRVVTLHEDHFRAAMSAPWYIDFDSQPRMTSQGVAFFSDWLAEYETRLKRLPAEELSPHVRFVRAARKFWADRAARASRVP